MITLLRQMSRPEVIIEEPEFRRLAHINYVNMKKKERKKQLMAEAIPHP